MKFQIAVQWLWLFSHIETTKTKLNWRFEKRLFFFWKFGISSIYNEIVMSHYRILNKINCSKFAVLLLYLVCLNRHSSFLLRVPNNIWRLPELRKKNFFLQMFSNNIIIFKNCYFFFFFYTKRVSLVLYFRISFKLIPLNLWPVLRTNSLTYWQWCFKFWKQKEFVLFCN